jgi:hypothetical protein
MREKTVEAALRKAVEDNGGLCLKWVCPGHTGVPDRMILFPGGVIAFVELKRPGAKVKAGGLQEWWREKLAGLGFLCYEISTVEQAAQLAYQLSAESFYQVTSCSDDWDNDWLDDPLAGQESPD